MCTLDLKPRPKLVLWCVGGQLAPLSTDEQREEAPQRARSGHPNMASSILFKRASQGPTLKTAKTKQNAFFRGKST